MFIGYTLLALPGKATWFIYVALIVISLGTGFFKGNMQALVGNLYDDPKYSKIRDSAFLIFYMGINIGAFFAPFAATSIKDYVMKLKGFTDSQGTNDYNLELSQSRADAVAMAIIKRGIDAERIRAMGYGEEFPVASNNNSGSRQLNRRVEIIVSNGGQPIPGRTAAGAP